MLTKKSQLTEKPKAQKKRFLELDALRGLAAVMVVLFHYTMNRPEAAYGFKFGTTGVDLFFIISGFVILLSLEHVKTAGQFLINRVSRLYPTYWACVVFTFLIMIVYAISRSSFAAISIPQFLGNLTMFQFYLGIKDLDGPYWTMIIEMLFYLFMVSLFHFKILKHLNLIGTGLTILILVGVYFFYDLSWFQILFENIPLLQFFPLFFAGTLFYKILFQNPNIYLIYGLICFCLISQVLLFDYSGRSISFITIREYAAMLSAYFLLFSLFVHNKLEFIVNKFSLFLGKISYALYLIHQKLSISYIIPLLMTHLGFHFWAAALVALLTVVGVASLITYSVEIPFSYKMRKKLTALFIAK